MKIVGKRKFAAFGAIALIAGVLVSWAFSPKASATEAFVPPDISEYCEDVYETQDNPDYVAAGWQRYSWNGSWEGDGNPPFPDDNWQANTASDPHGIGVEGAYYRSQGNGSWFYLEATPAVGEPTIQVQVGETCDLWVTWLAPGWFPNATDADSIGWPQSFVGLGQIAPTVCETTHQQDRYVGDREDIDALLADGSLTGPNPPEDNGVVTEWNIVSTEACPIPVQFSFGITIKDLCGWSNDHYGLPQNTEAVTFTRDGRDIVATLTDGYILPETLPTGWVATGTGAVYAFNADLFDESTPCTERPDTQIEALVFEGTPTCEATTVATWTEQRERLFTYDVESETWVAGDWSAWAIVEGSEGVRELTAEEITELACPVDTPETPPATPPNLADTGTSPVGVILTALLVFGVGVVLVMSARRRS